MIGFYDPESGIDYCQFYVGSEEGYQDVYQSPKINGCRTVYGVPGMQALKMSFGHKNYSSIVPIRD